LPQQSCAAAEPPNHAAGIALGRLNCSSAAVSPSLWAKLSLRVDTLYVHKMGVIASSSIAACTRHTTITGTVTATGPTRGSNLSPSLPPLF
jgi:hypothetical protein